MNSDRKNGNWIGRLAVAIVGLSAIAAYFVPALSAQLEYSRVGIAAGEWWRMVTGHITHFTAEHLFWDVTAMVVLGSIVASRSVARFWWTLLGGAVAISAVLLIWMPGIAVYRGLSGVDSALFACAAVLVLREAFREKTKWKGIIAAAAVAAFLAKTLYEFATGKVIFVQDLGTGVTPVAAAHLAGAAWGFLVGLGSWTQKKDTEHSAGCLDSCCLT